jgi:hypothetical protein
VHAVAVSCSFVGIQNKLQAKLTPLLEDLDYNVGYPDPQVLARNREILLRTVLRKQQFAYGSVNRSGSEELDLQDYPSVYKFFTSLSGRWESDTISFWTAGRDIS